MPEPHPYDPEPHERYITEVDEALTDADLQPDNLQTSDPTRDDTHPQLDAWLPIALPAQDGWPYGVLLHWTWHHADPDDIHPDGPCWTWSSGVATEPRPLRVDGYAAPEVIVAAVQQIAEFGNPGPVRAGRWVDADQRDTDLHAWARRVFAVEGSGAR